jgi:uncharacterized protein (TIGR03435 family)
MIRERRILKGLLLLAATPLSVALPLASLAQMPIVNLDPSKPPAARIPEFDVVSIKPNKSGSGMFRSMTIPDGIRAENAPLIMLIRQAYGLFNSNDDLISRIPDWAKSDRFDIEAKVAGADVDDLKKLTRDQRGQMLQALLEDRFKLKAHRETMERPIYSLVVAKGGAKLKPATEGDTYPNGIKGPDGAAHGGMIRMGRTQFTVQAIAIADLLSSLTQITGRTVLDKTGLTGKYDISLEWTLDDATLVAPDGSRLDVSASGPNIFTAIQEQLGLKLEAGKGPVEGLVIDRLEKPSEN